MILEWFFLKRDWPFVFPAKGWKLHFIDFWRDINFPPFPPSIHQFDHVTRPRFHAKCTKIYQSRIPNWCKVQLRVRIFPALRSLCWGQSMILSCRMVRESSADDDIYVIFPGWDSGKQRMRICCWATPSLGFYPVAIMFSSTRVTLMACCYWLIAAWTTS